MAKEQITVCDNYDFSYIVHVEHQPHHGFSTAYYNGRIIGQCELGKIHQPFGDDDSEWDVYNERFAEWRDEIINNLKSKCREHFNTIKV